MSSHPLVALIRAVDEGLVARPRSMESDARDTAELVRLRAALPADPAVWGRLLEAAEALMRQGSAYYTSPCTYCIGRFDGDTFVHGQECKWGHVGAALAATKRTPHA